MIEPLSDDEWLNDVTTHLAKSGASLRSARNDALTRVGAVIPKRIHGMPVEYDINYESPALTIRGYKMTDMLTTCAWVAPANTVLTVGIFEALIGRGYTDEGMRVLEAITTNATDKYQQRPIRQYPEGLVVMPGSNLLLKKTVDFDVIDQAVAQGAFIKPHPITNRLDMYTLRQRYGARVMEQTGMLHPLLRRAKRVFVGTNSESGIAAVMYGVPYTLIDAKRLPARPTYQAFYKVMESSESPLSPRERLAALFSYPESGIFSIYHEDVEARVAAFIAHYAQFQHGRT